MAGLVTTTTAAATATRLRRLVRASAPLPEPLRRYFRPGVNWAGRTVYGIPVFGFALLAMSQGAYALGDGWVLGGLALFVAFALLAEGVVVAGRAPAPGGPGLGAAPLPAIRARRDSCEGDATSMATGRRRRARRAARAGVVLMIAQP